MEVFAIIMAGGVGARIWPISRNNIPKQLLSLFGEKTMLQSTYDNIKSIVKNENILVITNIDQQKEVKKQLPELAEENIISEPFGKNTASTIALGNILVKKRNPESIVINVPADHVIKDLDNFRETLLNAVDYAEEYNGLITIGIKPTYAETGYGYIQYDESKLKDNLYKALTFAEKPNFGTAKRFVRSGDFLWNSGIFVWKLNVIEKELYRYLPDLSEEMELLFTKLDDDNFDKNLRFHFGQLRNISIDYGLMEKSKIVFVVKGNFDWCDLGSWDALYKLSEKDDDENSTIGDIYLEKSYGSLVYSPNKFSAIIGVENLVVVNTKDALLVCDRGRSQDVKKIVDYLRMHNRNELL